MKQVSRAVLLGRGNSINVDIDEDWSITCDKKIQHGRKLPAPPIPYEVHLSAGLSSSSCIAIIVWISASLLSKAATQRIGAMWRQMRMSLVEGEWVVKSENVEGRR